MEPVPPFQSGEGLPYAPTNWPNPGDTWGWKVGRRFNSFGYYTDRFLYLPRSLHKPSIPKKFASKLTVERYIRSQFPDADIDAFWASFSWKVPALKNSTGGQLKFWSCAVVFIFFLCHPVRKSDFHFSICKLFYVTCVGSGIFCVCVV